MIFAINQVMELKNLLAEKFGLHLHFHDACGAQSFSFDEAVTEEVKKIITEYAKTVGATVRFADTNDSFIVQ